MTTTIIAAAAVAGALALLLLALAAGRRGRGPTEVRLTAALPEVNARLDTLAGELAGALERAQEEGRRSRVLGELGGSIDLDEVLTRTLEAAGALPSVDSALITIAGGRGDPVVAALGLSIEEAEAHSISGPPDGRKSRAIALSYAYGHDESLSAEPLRHGLAVPLSHAGEHLGYLAVYSRSEGGPFDEAALRELEELALRAGPALDNARSFREARQLADLDALTNLHNRRFFHETLAREVARAHRYQRSLALIVFDLDDFKAINDRIGHLAGDSVLAEAAERIRDVVRSADIACRVGGDEFAVILPESAATDADQLYKRLQAAVSSRPIGQAGRLKLSAGIAELKAEDDGVSFFQRADEALYRAKDAGKGTAVASGEAEPRAEWPRSAPGS